MKRRYVAYSVIFAVSMLIGTQAIEVVDANPPPAEKDAPLTVILLSPTNNETIPSNNLEVNLTVVVPVEDIDTLIYPNHIPSEANVGRVTLVLDRKLVSHPASKSYSVSYVLPQKKMNYYFYLSNLTQGEHSLIVEVSYSFSTPNIQLSLFGSSDLVYFTILSSNAPPYNSQDVNYKIDLLNPTSNTAYTGSMPLNFKVEWAKGNWTSWIKPFFSFRIDNKSVVDTNGGQHKIDFGDTNQAITETNDTIDISELANGVHTLSLYSWGDIDEADLMITRFNYTLLTFDFVVDNGPFSSFSPSAVVILGLIAIVTVASVSLIYFKRRKGKP
jgi:hypothetical protein